MFASINCIKKQQKIHTLYHVQLKGFKIWIMKSNKDPLGNQY